MPILENIHNNPRFTGFWEARGFNHPIMAPKPKTVTLKDLYKAYKGICQICLKVVTLDKACKEHLIPQSKGGTNDFSNIVLAHRKCNRILK